MLKTGYINIYRSGHFHREGKPNTFDRHGGDVYGDFDEAIKNIEPANHYVATCPISWDDTEDIVVNPSHSVPVPLSVSRKRFYAAEEVAAT